MFDEPPVQPSVDDEEGPAADLSDPELHPYYQEPSLRATAALILIYLLLMAGMILLLLWSVGLL